MKRTLLLALGTACLMGAQAQTSSQSQGWVPTPLTPAQENTMVEIPYRDYKLGTETPSQKQISNASNYTNAQRAITETVIGTTRYDLQTNASMQRRIINHANGDIAAVWTYSNVNTWATRGTGYNFFDGTTWGAAPTAEIETERTGWPNLGMVGAGTESIFAHNTLNDVIRRSDRTTAGSGTWNQVNLNPLDIQVWTRMASGGPGNNTVHLIGLTLPTTITTGNPGVPYNGIDGALLYNRSTDGGQTWDIISLQLPNGDSTHWEGYGGDSYSIDAQGNTVAIVVGTFGYGVQLWKSTDNGSNWTHTVIVEPVFPRFDENIHFIDGNIDSSKYTSDENVHVLLDGSDNAHVFFGRQRLTNATLGDGAIGFFPFQNGIDYWNETWGSQQPLTIAGALDHNANGGLDIPDNTWLASYRFTGLASAPTAGIDANGDLYVVYHAVHEEHDNLAQKYRRIYACKSTDGGCTWTAPVDLTDDVSHDFDECAYPSMARRVDSKIHVVYQRDFEPGIAVTGDEDPVVTNDILYLGADVTDLGNTPAVCAHGINSTGGTTFCAGDTIVLEAFCGQSYVWSTGATTQSISVTNYGQYIVSTTTNCGVLMDTVTVSAPLNGPSVTVSGSNGLELCPGDSTVLTASTASTSVSFLWSTGSTSATTTITAIGTYTVTATDCGGSTVQNITVGTPGPPSSSITGPTFVCPGQSFTLNVVPVSGGSYTWFNGSTGTSITLFDTTGVFMVNVSNCGGSTVASINVTTEPAPSPTVTASGALEFCDGDDVTLTGGGGLTYRWDGPNGFTSTGSAITLNQIAQTGNYMLTAFNGCNDSATTATATAITVNPLPAVPSISYSNGTYTSSATSGNQWSVNGSIVPGEIQKTFSPAGNTSGFLIAVTVTDGNGCTSEGTITNVNELNPSTTAFNVFPNPNDGQFTLQFTNAISDNYTIEVKNLLGQVIYSESLKINGNTNRNLNLNSVDQGVYLLTVRSGSSETTSRIMIR